MQKLRTKRLLLRGWEPADAPALRRISAQEHIARWLPDWQKSIGEADSWIAKVQGYYAADDPMTGFLSWAVTLAESGAVIGEVGVGHFEHREASLGYLADAAYCRQGYTTEAAAAVVAHIFATYGYGHMITTIRPDNTGSIRVAERLGFRLLKTIALPEGDNEPPVPYGYYRLDNTDVTKEA